MMDELSGLNERQMDMSNNQLRHIRLQVILSLLELDPKLVDILTVYLRDSI